MTPTRASLFPRREITLAALAELTGGALSPGADPNRLVSGLAQLNQAGPDQVSFLANRKFAADAEKTRAAAVLVPRGAAMSGGVATIETSEVWAAVVQTLNYFCPPDPPSESKHPGAVISPRAILGANVSVGPCAVIEDGARIGDRARIGAQCFVGRGAVIGEDTILHPQVVIAEGVELGRRVIVHSGAVLGADGFKFELIGGRLAKIPQVGTVVIEDDVEIGANTTIDRASLAETRVGARTKIDNQTHLAHNVVVGSDCLIVAQVGIAGSTRIGRGCVLAGQVGVADNIEITDGVRLGAKSGVNSSIREPGDYLGAPPTPAREQARILVALRQLPDLLREVRELRKKVEKDA